MAEGLNFVFYVRFFLFWKGHSPWWG